MIRLLIFGLGYCGRAVAEARASGKDVRADLTSAINELKARFTRALGNGSGGRTRTADKPGMSRSL